MMSPAKKSFNELISINSPIHSTCINYMEMLDIMMGGLGSGTLGSQASQEKSIGKDPKFVYAVRAYTDIYINYYRI